MSAIKIVMENNFSYLLLSVYLPCDNFCNILNQSYAAEINVMEHIFNTVSCNALMICGDFNTFFSRDNAQTTHLSDVMHRNYLTCTWGHSNSRPDFTYNNFALNHISCIDHFIVSRNVYDNIHLNHVICDPTNLSNHNSIQLVFDNFQTPINLIDSSCNDPLKQSTHCNWSKATQIHTRNYAANLDQVLQSIDISNDLFTCNDLCCTNAMLMLMLLLMLMLMLCHVNAIDKLSACIVKCCIECGVRCILHSRSRTRVVPGWNDHVKHDKDQSLFWHWIWTEAVRPNSGYIIIYISNYADY